VDLQIVSKSQQTRNSIQVDSYTLGLISYRTITPVCTAAFISKVVGTYKFVRFHWQNVSEIGLPGNASLCRGISKNDRLSFTWTEPRAFVIIHCSTVFVHMHVAESIHRGRYGVVGLSCFFGNRPIQ